MGAVGACDDAAPRVRVDVDEARRDDLPWTSITRAAGSSIDGAIRTIVSPRIATSPVNHGLPVPSTMRPCLMRRSYGAGWKATVSATSEAPRTKVRMAPDCSPEPAVRYH